jgi:hypothetical protein
LELSSIQQAMTAYFFRTGHHPSQLEDLIDAGDMRSIVKDPWDQDYVFLPQLDWNRVLRVCQGVLLLDW